LEKSATLLAYLLSKLINEQSGIFYLLHEKSKRAGWKENLKNLSEHALLLGTSEYVNWSETVENS
jgi:phage terminase large subunit-like protein